MQKVTDREIYVAVWNEQLKHMCASFLMHYVGGEYALSSREMCELYDVQMSSMQRKKLNIGLSPSQLLKRIRAMVKTGDLTSKTRDQSNAFYYGVERNDKFEKAITYIRVCWHNYGVTCGRGNLKSMTKSELDTVTNEIRDAILSEFKL